MLRQSFNDVAAISFVEVYWSEEHSTNVDQEHSCIIESQSYSYILSFGVCAVPIIVLRDLLWIAPMVGEEYSKPNYESLFYSNRTTQKDAQCSVWKSPIIVR